MKPHKHAELIKAWADGAEIEFRYKIYAEQKRWGNWEGMPSSIYCWSADPDFEYRIKPEPKPDVEKFFILESNPILGLRLNEIAGFKKQPHEDWIRVVFDGETAKMKLAEVLK